MLLKDVSPEPLRMAYLTLSETPALQALRILGSNEKGAGRSRRALAPGIKLGFAQIPKRYAITTWGLRSRPNPKFNCRQAP